MLQRDLLKDQIEQAGKVLGRFLLKFTGIEPEEHTVVIFNQTNELLKTELNLDLDHLSDLDNKELAAYFELKKLNATSIESYADYLSQHYRYLGTQLENQEHIRKTALRLYELVDDLTATVDFERMDKIKRLS